MTSPKILSYIVFSTLCTSAMAQDDVCDVIKNTKRHYAVLYEASTNGGRTFFKSENHIYRRDDGTVVVVNVSGDLILSKTIYERARSASEGGKNQNMGHVGSRSRSIYYLLSNKFKRRFSTQSPECFVDNDRDQNNCVAITKDENRKIITNITTDKKFIETKNAVIDGCNLKFSKYEYQSHSQRSDGTIDKVKQTVNRNLPLRIMLFSNTISFSGGVQRTSYTQRAIGLSADFVRRGPADSPEF